MEQRLPFHQQLRHERERHGWSQADLAAKLGSDPKTINRWESGKSLPRPYFRQKFFDLFGKNIGDLGLTNDANMSGDMLCYLHREDWGEVPYLEVLHGRDKEHVELKSWIEDHRCRVITVLGIGGVGKTALVAKLAHQIKDTFECVFWRSLQNAPPLEHVLKQCIHCIADQQLLNLPERLDDQISLLIQHSQNHRCLFVLDNVESVLQPNHRVGQYREGYENYGRLIQRLGESSHQSCLLLTSREKPKEVAYLEGKTSPVRSLHLLGIGQIEGQELLRDKGLFGTQEQWADLVHLYAGNPLALKLVAESIQEIFGGNIARFLLRGETAFGDINDLLNQQFCRLSAQEREVLYWLAIEREAVSLEDIYDNMVYSALKGVLLETLNSLLRRFFVEVHGTALFTLQAVIMEYVTNELVKRACDEFSLETIDVWTHYAFIKAQAKDYVRDSQKRLILAPIAQQLLITLGRDAVEKRLKNVLARQRQRHTQQYSYVAGNILNLFSYLQYDFRHSDFSGLVVRQAYLQNVPLPHVNFAHTHFISSVFTNTFGNILSVAWSPHENLLAVGTATGEIWIYQMPSETLLLTCRGHTDGTWAVAFSPNGGILASSSDDKTIRLWELATGHCLKVLQEHTDRVRSVAFSPDGSIFASGSDDQTIRLWDTQTASCLKTLQGHTDRVWSVAFNGDGSILATGSTDQTMRLWDVREGHCLKVLQGHTDSIRSLSFIPGRNILASGCDDYTVRLWNIDTGQCLSLLQGHTNRIWSVTCHPNGHLLTSSSEDHTIRLWDVSTGRCLNTLQAHTQGVRSVAMSTDGRTLASGGDDQTLRLWDVQTGYCLKTLQGYTNRIWSVSFNPRGQMLANASEDQRIRLWDVSTGSCLNILQVYKHGARSIAFSPDGVSLASGGEDQTIHLWDVTTGQNLRSLHGHTDWIRSVTFSADGQMLASGSEDRTIRVWEISTGHCLHVLDGHTSWIRSIALSPDGRILASGSDDQTIRIWEVSTGHCLHILHGHTERVRTVTFSPDGSLVASGGEDQIIRLWDINSAQCIHVLLGHTNWVRAVTFHPKEPILASCSDDQTIYTWNIDAGYHIKTLRGHNNRVRSISFAVDGHLLVSGSDDGTMKFWNIQTAECLKTLTNEMPYEHMNITGATGLTEAQKTLLLALGAIEDTALPVCD